MIDRIALAFLFVVGIGCVVSIWRDRKAHDRELEQRRTRLYRGQL